MQQGRVTSVARNLARFSVFVALACAIFALSTATALASSGPVITSPPQGSESNNAEPSFSGTTEDELDAVVLNIYAGSGPGGSPVQTLSTLLPPVGGSWSLSASHLGDGEYTAVAEQTPLLGEAETSSPVTFTIDTSAPGVSIDGVPSPSADSTPTLKGGAGTASGDKHTVTVTIHSGSLAGPVVGSPHVVPTSGSSWSFTSATLSSGTYAAQVIQEDEVGNVGSDSTSFTIDTSAPGVSIDGVPSPSNDTTPTLKGGAGTAAGDEASVTVTLHSGSSVGGPVVGSSHTVPTSGASWSFTTPTLGGGTYTAQVTQEDNLGNVGEDSTTFTIVTSAPAVSIFSVPSPTKDSTPTLQGHLDTSAGDDQAATVTIRHDGSAVSSGGASISGDTWTYTPSPLADGAYTATVTQSNEVGNTGEDSTGFTVDTTAPGVGIDSVPSPSHDATPTLEGAAGTAEGDDTSVSVTVHAGGSTSGSVVASHTSPVSGGRWSFTVPTLSDGTYTVQAVQHDVAGNTGEATPVTFVVDATLPTVSINDVPSPGKDSTPKLEGHAGTAAGDANAVTVTIHAGGSVGGTVVGSPQSAGVSGGAWSFTPGALADGTYTAQVTQRNEAGDVAEDSTTFTIDTTAPSVSINSIASPTKDQTPTLEGAGGSASGDQATVNVKVHAGGSTAGSVVAEQAASVSGGKWSFTTPTLSDGTYTVQAVQHDAAGNVGEAAPVTFVVDSTPPSVSINTIPTPSKNLTPKIEGHAGTAPGDSSAVTVTYHSGSSAAGPVLGSPQSAPISGGAWSFTAGLTDGTFTVQVTQRNEAGEVAEATDTFTIDTTAPVVTINAVPSPTKDSTPSLSGTAGSGAGDAGNVTLTLHAGTTIGGATVGSPASVPVAGGEWAFTTPHLSDGTYTVQVTQRDAVGNVGEATPVTFTVDATGPSVSIEGVPSPGKNAAPILKGAGGSAPGDSPTVTASLHAGTSVGGALVAGPAVIPVSGGKWGWETPHLADGTYTAQVVQQDGAGNVGEASTTFTVDTTAPLVSIQQLATPTGNATPTLAGAGGTLSGDAGSVTLTIHKGATIAGVSVAGPTGVPLTTGNWTYKGAHLEDGVYTVQVTQTDQAGNEGEAAPMTFTLNTALPAISISPLQTPSKNTSPILKGAAGTRTEDKPSVNLTLSRAGETISSQPVPVSAGAWSLPLSHLPDGSYRATAAQQDTEGFTGEATVAFVIDTTAPIVTLSEMPHVGNSKTPTLHGTAGTAPGDLPTVTVTIHKGTVTGPEAGPPIKTPVNVALKTWSIGTPSLADGKYTAQVKQEDEAGNSSEGTPVTFAVDTEAPKIKLEHPTNNSSETVVHPVFSGARGQEPGDLETVQVLIYQGATATGAPLVTEEVTVTGNPPTWSTGPIKKALPSGSIYTAVAEQQDEGGNLGKSEVQFQIFTLESPRVTIDERSFAERGEQLFSGPVPTFHGTAGVATEDGKTIIVRVERVASGHKRELVRELTPAVAPVSGEWTTGPVAGLEEGEYLVEAVQKGPKEPGSSLIGLTIDAQPPVLGLSSPANGGTVTGSIVPVAGTAGTAAGDSTAVTVQLFEGASAAGAPLNSITLQSSGGAWSGSLTNVNPGTYTVRAVQSDDVGNIGLSPASTFTVGGVPPVASFKWIPAKPHVGEHVSLVSTSTAVSTITGFAWDLLGTGPFKTGESVLATKFTTPGNHSVRLRVTDAVGATATVTEVVPVSKATAVLMSPFPIVRIAGGETVSGAKINLLTVQAPVGAKVSVTCKGHGCPTKSVSLLATLSKQHKSKSKSKAGTVLLSFRRFQRSLPAGVTLEIRVTKSGQIGKYTRFSVRKGKLPVRVDTCLSTNGVKPITCPTSG
jgi:uncharacterized protein (DUF2141 family)